MVTLLRNNIMRGIVLLVCFFISGTTSDAPDGVVELAGETFLEDSSPDSTVKVVVKRDANSQLAFLSFAMAMLNTIINVISAVNNNNNNNNNNDNNDNNMNVNMNDVMSMNKRRSFSKNSKNNSFFAALVDEETETRMIESISSWAREKVRDSPGCLQRFVCETYKTGETLSGLA